MAGFVYLVGYCSIYDSLPSLDDVINRLYKRIAPEKIDCYEEETSDYVDQISTLSFLSRVCKDLGIPSNDIKLVYTSNNRCKDGLYLDRFFVSRKDYDNTYVISEHRLSFLESHLIKDYSNDKR